MGFSLKSIVGAAAITVSALAFSTVSSSAEKVRIALGDVASVETLSLLVALERAKENGLDYELTTFGKEGLAIQAIISGQMDLGIGSPYSVIQKSKAPIRNFFQLSKLVFFPVAEVKYKTWQDMDGEPITLHSRGGGTDAIANIIAKREGITFGQRSYVPGSENRIVAMLKGQVNASIVDISNKNILMSKSEGRFHTLPGLDGRASDEILFANQNWIDDNQESVAILVESLLKTWQEVNEDPTIVDRERKRFNLLSDLPEELLSEVDAYYQEAVDGGLYDPNGGGADAARADFEFYGEAGQLAGDPATLKVEDFWNLGPLNAALAKQ
ncbi:ABC transporter substrate-binding protein [Roseibium polysiphoniae]|uniref:ABC transporter substrate-binding protein n=1 Tax=Roseibium polysiphoniae TaxID=2571221 RepID=A0A944GTP0_9HYPH|nr:ABC transporter substrate-binding protein [Roseibium polysiphoniae]MBS8260665.1 ABC transporter substrate-binding protein [Roseibium polysiphoniae]